MSVTSPVLLITAVTLAAVSAVYSASLFHLERSPPLNSPVAMEQLKAWDRARHAHLFEGSLGGVVNFSLQGSAGAFIMHPCSETPNWMVAKEEMLYTVQSVYLAPIKLGFPPQEFKVLVDTGSDMLWVNSNACVNCPHYNRFGMPLNFFDTTASSTGGSLPCSNQFCVAAARTAATHCHSGQCSYTIQYADRSGTSGLYMIDRFYLSSISSASMVTTFSALVVFGVSSYQSGTLVDTYNGFDDIFGFGRGDLSVISQLSSRAITPRVFSHCLKGEGIGGGILVLGEILQLGMVYTPLVPSQRHYNLYLQSIAVNGHRLPIDPIVFATSTHHGTIVDSGTSMVYITEEAYDPLVNAITGAVSHYATPRIYSGRQCYLVSSSVSHTFPLVSFSFMGGALLVIKPEDYLVVSNEGTGMWCLGFLKSSGRTILPEIILKDKIFIYDMDNERIGWVDYNCSSAVNISLSSKDFMSHRQSNLSSSYTDLFLELWPLAIAALMLHMLGLVDS